MLGKAVEENDNESRPRRLVVKINRADLDLPAAPSRIPSYPLMAV